MFFGVFDYVEKHIANYLLSIIFYICIPVLLSNFTLSMNRRAKI